MKCFLFFFWFLNFFLIGLAYAEMKSNSVNSESTPSYPVCSDFSNLPEKNNFCPRIEGQHPGNCCPPLVRTPPKECHYARRRRQPVLVNGSYTVCESGRDVSNPCCKASSRDCYDQLEKRTFYSYLTKFESGCCYAICPTASYWSDHPDPSKRMPPSHHRLGENPPPSSSICTNEVTNECTHGDTANCKSSTPCPPPPPNCCADYSSPPTFKCYYAIPQGPRFIRNSTYRVCENGRTVTKPCCRTHYKPCYRQLEMRLFTPQNCCHGCPLRWKDLPRHVLYYGGSGNPPRDRLCTDDNDEITNECTHGDTPCKLSTGCGVGERPTTPTPTPTPKPPKPRRPPVGG